MKKRVKQICPTCKKEFFILESRLKWGGTFCSRKCHMNRKNNVLKKQCTICSKNYNIWPYQEKIKAPTCSSECTRIYIRNKYNKKVKCPKCQKWFWTSKKNPAKYCSIECRNKSYIGKNLRGSYKICPTCENDFYVEQAKLVRGEGIFCSRICRDNFPNKTVEERIKGGGLVKLKCAWCNKEFIRARYFKEIQQYCSQECSKKSKNETLIESKIRDLLEKYNIYFEQEKPIKNASGKRNYFVDFFIPPNIIIECNGDFWHNPKLFPRSCNKDKIKIKYLKKKGYNVFVFNETQINNNSEGLIKNIINKNPELVNISKEKVPIKKSKRRIIITKICKSCGQKFLTISSRALTQQFCDLNCKNNYHRVTLNCKNCNNKFIVPRYRIRKFCSNKCQTDFTNEKNKKLCLNCKEVFYPNPADVKRGRAKFCSRNCVLEYKNGKD
ncbi:MAG: DUF559 domain-containing protein [archaeon]